MRADGRAATVDVRARLPGDGREIDVAVVCGGEHGCLDRRDVNVAVVGGDIDCGGRGHRDDQVAAGAIERRHGDLPRGVAILIVRVELLRFGFGVAVRAGVHLLVDGKVHLVVVAGAADGHTAARIHNRKRVAGREGEVERRVRLMLIAEQLVEGILVKVVAGKHLAVARRKLVDMAGYDAGEHEEQQQDDDATTDRAPVHRPLRIAEQELVDRPLGQHNDARADQQQRPPVSVPSPEAVMVEAAGLDQQEHNADRDQQDRSQDRTAAH